MPTRPFREIRDAARSQWSDDARAVNDAAAAYFAAISEQQIAIGRQIAELRVLRKLNQKQLEDLSGINQSEISRIENGLGNPTEETLVRITTALGARVTLQPV
ncbi:helix-turn-helix domain-containing protein [Herbiconiux sp. CPCC 205763]|uniref:Helix-turn-helix domain-containing protein n=1 Tax=Herbiconiux aconitum TaxID=2970913 RepID=A0ABT2GNI0_9MICO|nr:helix-turn-helix transcriptional regulator [Herbiconiux aconitum]MCS5717777.1 helix-turn-helix domain-containing protein [Herbiconiux aconitum]